MKKLSGNKRVVTVQRHGQLRLTIPRKVARNRAIRPGDVFEFVEEYGILMLVRHDTQGNGATR